MDIQKLIASGLLFNMRTHEILLFSINKQKEYIFKCYSLFMGMFRSVYVGFGVIILWVGLEE